MAVANVLVDLKRTVAHPLTISEVAAAFGTNAKAINRLVDSGMIPKHWVLKRKASGNGKPVRLLTAEATPLVAFLLTSGEAASTSLIRSVQSRLASLSTGGADAEMLQVGFLHVDMEDVCRAALTNLNDLAKAEKSVVIDPDIRGGIPVMRGTRIGVYEVADLLKSSSVDEILENFPSLTPESIESAKLYAKAHPRPGRPRRMAAPTARPGSREVKRTRVGLKAN
ncbi:MAG: DUF433 domain-containing protein [Salinarimonas sp.]